MSNKLTPMPKEDMIQAILSITDEDWRLLNIVIDKPDNMAATMIYFNMRNKHAANILRAKLIQLELSIKNHLLKLEPKVILEDTEAERLRGFVLDEILLLKQEARMSSGNNSLISRCIELINLQQQLADYNNKILDSLLEYRNNVEHRLERLEGTKDADLL